MSTYRNHIVPVSAAIAALILASAGSTAATPAASASLESSSGSNNTQVSADALARAQAKFAHALAIADQFKPQAESLGIKGDSWRFDMVGNLMKGAEENFAAVSLARSYQDAMGAAVQVGRMPTAASSSETSGVNTQSSAQGIQPKTLGTATSDLVYVPITPCRIVDTRAGGAAIPAGQVSTFIFTAANVGASTSCSVLSQIPGSTAAAAFAANITVDETGLTGFAAGAYLEAFPQGGSTSTSFMNFGPNQIIANAGIISLNQANGEFSVVASAASQVIVDTYGVFIAPQATAFSCVNTTLTTTTLTAGQDTYVTLTACPSGYTPVVPYCYTADTSTLSQGSGIVGPSVGQPAFCAWHNYGGASSTVYGATTCCRVPGR